LRTLEAVGLRSHDAGDEVLEGNGTGDRMMASVKARREVELAQSDEIRAVRDALDQATSAIRHLPGYEEFLGQLGFERLAEVVSAATAVAYVAVTPAGSLVILVHGLVPGATASAELIPMGEASFTYGDLSRLLVQREGEEVVGGYLFGQLEDSIVLYNTLSEWLPKIGEPLIAPLAAQLNTLGIEGVTLIPCGLLGLLPLHAALYRHDDGSRCLLNEFDVAYAPSARALIAAQTTLRKRERQVPTLVGVGNPLPSDQSLQYARLELAEIATQFDHAFPEYEERATKQWLIATASHADYIHLACHGRFNGDHPLDSEIQLAQNQTLSLRDVLIDRPFANSRLIAASACETGITEFNRLPDEAVGLPSGFLEAGTPGVIATLWSVNDLSTALLMVRFYELHLVGDQAIGEGPMTPARALRKAQCWLAEATVQELDEYCHSHPALEERASFRAQPNWNFRPYSNPYHWAPFQLIGT
jgi:CHAT domain-containing protein